ncbi:exotoxin [Enterobacterales bacterium CwR94]|nr:exotoxin [Enterobacterales bacterium CwR94]
MNKIHCRAVKCSLLLTMMFSTVVFSKDNLMFSGTLVKLPCIVKPGKEVVNVDFKSITTKNIYRYERTKSYPFSLEFTECDTNIGDKMKITFTGQESSVLPGLLETSNIDGQPSGLAVGIELENKEPLMLNKGMIHKVTTGDSTAQFYAYVKGEPKAIADKKIFPGTFTATSTVIVEYD